MPGRDRSLRDRAPGWRPRDKNRDAAGRAAGAWPRDDGTLLCPVAGDSGVAKPPPGQHVPARAVERGRWRAALPPSGRHPLPVRRTALRSPADRKPSRGPDGPRLTGQAGTGLAGRTATTAGRPGAQRVRHRCLGGRQGQGRDAGAADRRALHGRGGAPDLGRGGHRLVPCDVGRSRRVGPALPAAGTGRDRAATGAARVLHGSASRVGQEGARDPAGGFLRANHRQRLGVRSSGRGGVRAGRRRRARSGRSRPRPQERVAAARAGRRDTPDYPVRIQ
jgi:hypothetical protein